MGCGASSANPGSVIHKSRKNDARPQKLNEKSSKSSTLTLTHSHNAYGSNSSLRLNLREQPSVQGDKETSRSVEEAFQHTAVHDLLTRNPSLPKTIESLPDKPVDITKLHPKRIEMMQGLHRKGTKDVLALAEEFVVRIEKVKAAREGAAKLIQNFYRKQKLRKHQQAQKSKTADEFDYVS